MKTNIALTLALALLAQPASLAKEPGGQGPQLKYLMITDIAPFAMLPPPSSDGSRAQREELAELQAIAKSRSDARLAQARSDDVTINGTIFQSAIPGLDLAKLPVTGALLNAVKAEANTVSHAAKVHFDRKRPYEFDPSLNVCSQHRGKNATYPSGHTTVGFAMASALARLVPQHAGPVMARAREYGESRMVCGVHYRSDVVAGQVVGTSVVLAMLQSPQFQTEIAAARAELIAAGLTK